MSNRILLLSTALVLALGGAGMAQSASPRRLTQTDVLQAMQSATIAPAQAIAAAERYTGGRAVGFAMARDDGVPRYAVQTLVGKRVKLAYVDTALGTVNRAVDQGRFDRVFHHARYAALQDLALRKANLADAVIDAARDSGGRVLEAKPILMNGREAFRLDVYAQGKVQPAIVG
jgi:hypothetical protein